MLQMLRSKKGFTLIELLIVVAIIAILAMIAIPQFTAYQKRGYASATRSDVRNLHTAIKAAFSDNLNATATSNLVPSVVGTYTQANQPAAPIAAAKMSAGVTAIVSDASEDLYTITGSHAKLQAGDTYILTGAGYVTDTLSAHF